MFLFTSSRAFGKRKSRIDWVANVDCLKRRPQRSPRPISPEQEQRHRKEICFLEAGDLSFNLLGERRSGCMIVAVFEAKNRLRCTMYRPDGLFQVGGQSDVTSHFRRRLSRYVSVPCLSNRSSACANRSSSRATRSRLHS